MTSYRPPVRALVDDCRIDQLLRTIVVDIVIVRAAIAMAQGLDIEVAAEGVETISQLEFLRSCKCDLAQGFLISRPMQPEKVSAILRSEIAGTRLVWNPGDAAEDMEPIRPHPRWKLKGR